MNYLDYKLDRRVKLQLRRSNRVTYLLALSDKPGRKRRKRKKRPHLFEAQNHRCAYCHRIQTLTIDHVVALSMGGEDTVDNMVGACDTCNKLKGAINGYTFYYLLHPQYGLAQALEELFLKQPWEKHRLPSIAEYSKSLHHKLGIYDLIFL